jgi:hypothetical protein
MSYELYEVWAEDESGHEELIETTRSRPLALKLAQESLNDGFVASIVYQETDDGDLEELKRYTVD